jgi:DNA processing protein
VLAALTFATVVVQAREKSGARSTARYARLLGRPLFAVPHAPWEEGGRGCAIEIVLGARAIVSEGELVAELYERRRRGEAGGEGHDVARSRGRGALVPRAREVLVPRAHERAEVLAREHAPVRALQDLDEETTHVLGAISEVPIHMDDLCERAALPIGAVAAALLTLTLGAVVVEAPAGYYRRLPTI